MTTPKARVGNAKGTTEQRHKLFIAAYLSNGHNASAAAIAAGYSAKTAHAAGHRLMKDPRVAKRLAAIAERVSQRAELTIERTLREVARLAYFDPRSLYRPDGSLKNPGEWDEDTAAAVSSLELADEGHKVRFWDKNAALEKAMKHLGLFERDNAQQGRESLVLKVEMAKPVKS